MRGFAWPRPLLLDFKHVLFPWKPGNAVSCAIADGHVVQPVYILNTVLTPQRLPTSTSDCGADVLVKVEGTSFPRPFTGSCSVPQKIFHPLPVLTPDCHKRNAWGDFCVVLLILKGASIVDRGINNLPLALRAKLGFATIVSVALPSFRFCCSCRERFM